MTKLIVQIYRQGQWQDAAEIQFKRPGDGHRSATTLDYAGEYVVQQLGETDDGSAAVSAPYPVNFETYASDTWPAFLLDLLPGGEGRRRWSERLGVGVGASAEFELLRHGAANPPGNIRIKESIESEYRDQGQVPDHTGELRDRNNHPGFNRQDIIERQEHFIEYAYQSGAAVSGASDVQGEAPKFLLTQDRMGNWHAEGALADTQAAKHWIVKFPRGSTAADLQVLRNEAGYLEVARLCGLKVGEPLTLEGRALFIPRFDRKVSATGIERLGMESLYALAGIAEFGRAVPHETLCEALLRHLPPDTHAETIVEYIRRDILNVVMGNTDNHGRNTAVLRDQAGAINLSPLFDFAPMFLDPQGIARVSRWSDEREQAGRPNWARVAEYFDPWLDAQRLKEQLCAFAAKVEAVPTLMQNVGIDEEIIELRRHAIDKNAALLRDCTHAQG